MVTTESGDGIVQSMPAIKPQQGKRRNGVRKILVFRSGLLGDTLVALPALHCLKSEFPNAEITYVWQKTEGNRYVTPPDVLDGSGLVDSFYGYLISGPLLQRLWAYIKLAWFCSTGHFDLAVVLEPPHWPGRRKKFLRLCGIFNVVGPDGRTPFIYRDATGNLPATPKIADSLIAVLDELSVDLPVAGAGKFDLCISPLEIERAKAWIETLVFERSNGTRLLAVAPGSNMQTKRWPKENFLQAIAVLIERFDLLPIVLGGKDDQAIAEYLISAWGRGINATGQLSVRQGVAVMQQCSLYLGNDTGTMHMAVAAGLQCVAVFAAIDMPGRWEPYGGRHRVLRARVPCDGCMLRVCDKGPQQCINLVSVDEVVAACIALLK